MRKTITLLLFMALATNLFAEIAVKSFRKLENDLTARTYAPKDDQNGVVCAIIKVVTSQTGISWDPDGLGIVSAEYKNGEYWLYIPYGAKRLTIKHAQLGVLRDYLYPLPIEKASVYEMVLETSGITPIVPGEITSQWLLLKVEPANAQIYINDEFAKIGEYQAKRPQGKYTYRVEAPMYHAEAGAFEITDAKKVLDVKLKPAFGYLNITSNPEADATIVIDGKEQPQHTPFKTEAFASGEHTVQAVKEMYQPQTRKVSVADGQTLPVDFILQPNFAELNINCPADALVYVNNQQKATGAWKGRLGAGVYSLEVRKDKHRTVKQEVELNAGDKRSFDMQPTPILGSLDITSTPADATITIAGKDCGTTPITINKLPIGEYTVTLSKTGYATITRTVTISEGKTSELNETLEQAKVAATTPNKPTTNNATTVTDIDGNVYHTVTIGTQVWMVENLKTTKLNDGTTIPKVTDNAAWANLKSPGYCFYNNDVINKNVYGPLYNWYAVNSGKLAPKGWHVPTDAEWTTLSDFLGGESKAGGKLKEKGTAHWKSPNTGATNKSGFTALPGGYRDYSGTFSSIGSYGDWWSSSENYTINAWNRHLNCGYYNMSRSNDTKSCGFSVRCVKD